MILSKYLEPRCEDVKTPLSVNSSFWRTIVVLHKLTHITSKNHQNSMIKQKFRRRKKSSKIPLSGRDTKNHLIKD